MRKFRVWNDDKIFKCWETNVSITEDGILLLNGRGLDYDSPIEPGNPEHYIVEFYTEVEDRHEKETCEGDICIFYRENIKEVPPHEYTYYVVGIGKYLQCDDKTFKNYDNYGFYLKNTKYDNASRMLYPYEDLEIVGNIHENPELLK